MQDPIAYTYEADTHCPACAVARFGHEPGHAWPPESARDSEGNPIGAIAPWDEWCEPSEPGQHVLACGTCGGTIEEHDGPPDEDLRREDWTGACLAHPKPVPLDQFGHCPTCAYVNWRADRLANGYVEVPR